MDSFGQVAGAARGEGVWWRGWEVWGDYQQGEGEEEGAGEEAVI